MSTPHKEERFADDLQEVADVLRDRRATLDPLALDAIKLRAMTRARRSTSSRQKGFFMRSRLTTVLTIAFLSLGTGGALAWVGGEDFGLGGHDGGSASFDQYRECDHGEGRGKDHECHGHEGEHGHDGEGDQGHGQGGGDQGGGDGHGNGGGDGNGGDGGGGGGDHGHSHDGGRGGHDH